MKKQRDFTAKKIRGNNIYHIKSNNQTIFYDRFTKTAYIITNPKARVFYAWQYRLPFCLIIAGLLGLFTKNYSIAAIVSVSAFILSSILFRVLYLKNAPINTNFVLPESKGIVRDLASKYTKNSLIIAILLFGSIAASLLVNQLARGLSGKKVIIVYICIVIFTLISLFIGYIIHIKKKEKL